MGFESFVSGIFTGVENTASYLFHGVASTAEHTADNLTKVGSDLVHKAGDIVDNTVNKVGGVIKGLEFDLFIPLIAIGLGAMFLMRNTSGSDVAEIVRAAK